MQRDEAIARIKAALKKRTGKTWSVTGGRGTAWGWIHIKATPKKSTDGYGSLTAEQQAELAKALDLANDGRGVHHQGVSIPATHEFRQEYVARAEGRTPEVFGTLGWD